MQLSSFYLRFIWTHLIKSDVFKKMNNWKTPSSLDRRFTFCTQNGLVGNDVSEDTGLPSILWRIRSMPSEGVQKRRCVTSNVTAIRAPTYKEVVRKKKRVKKEGKSHKKKSDNLRYSPLRLFISPFFSQQGLRDDFAWSRNSCNMNIWWIITRLRYNFFILNKDIKQDYLSS